MEESRKFSVSARLRSFVYAATYATPIGERVRAALPSGSSLSHFRQATGRAAMTRGGTPT